MMELTRKVFYLIILLWMLSLAKSIHGQQAGAYYWIGGSGSWSDTLKWSSLTGGLPTACDHVIFDQNSFTQKFQTVTIDIEAYCRDMNWTGTMMDPFLEGNENLHIHGSLKLAPEMTVNYSGSIYFLSSLVNNQICINGNHLNSDLYFNNAGAWELTDDLNIGHNKIHLNKGTLSISGQTVTCGSFTSLSDTTRNLVMNGTSINLISSGASWNVNNQINLLGSENSLIRFTYDMGAVYNTFIGAGLAYGTVILNNSTGINGSNVYQNLYLGAAKTFVFEQNSVQTFTGQLNARGCAGYLTMKSSGENPVIFQKSNGGLSVSYASIEGVHSQLNPPYQFNAFNSIDDSGNDGINFTFQSRDLYWINGPGNWTDTTQWISYPLGDDSDCAPMAFDNVFFNNESFTGMSDTVRVNVPEVRVNNMAWLCDKMPVFLNPSQQASLSIYGSLQFAPKMVNAFNGIIYFSDTTGNQSIITAHTEFLNDLFFNGINGGWSIYDSLKTNGSIHFLHGNLNSNGNFIRTRSFHSDSAFSRMISLGSSNIQVSEQLGGSSWSLNNEFLDFDSGLSHIEIMAMNGDLSNYGGDTIQYNDISFLGITGVGRLATSSDSYGIFRNVSFMSNGAIQGRNSFDTVSFSRGCYYDLPPGNVQTIHGAITPSGACTGPVLLKSATNGQQATIQKSADTLLVEYTAIRDIIAAGGAVFMAEKSVDLGNNSGWDTISVVAPGKLYWVGDSGEWSNADHWSPISGGSGGYCIPTPYDTVIFDQNSFTATSQLVNIDLNNAFAGYMDWSNALYVPEFTGNINTSWLRIYGSLKLNPEMVFTFPGYISFESRHPDEFLLLEGIKFHNINNDVYFDGIGGEWTLMDNLQLGHSTVNRNDIYFYNGKLSTNNQFIDCYRFISNRPNQRLLNAGGSYFDIYQEWNVNGQNLIMVPNTSLITLSNGSFTHRFGDQANYHDVSFLSMSGNQFMLHDDVNEVFIRNVFFESPVGRMYGRNSVVSLKNAVFKGTGFVNTSNAANVNVYILDSLLFQKEGNIFGKDTVHHQMRFAGKGSIFGNGVYTNALFLNDGIIRGNNLFDTLTFNPPYTYELGSQNTQTINGQFNLTGNNCENIIMRATSGSLAEVFKESGEVMGNYTEMSKIRAAGGALFDAGRFSIDLDNSNEGWVFYDPELNYRLESDSSFQQGDTVYLCADHFGGVASTVYEWINCITGEWLGGDSCLIITEKGSYCLTVYYNEGDTCARSDSVTIGCYLGLNIAVNQVTCKGFSDGGIEVTVFAGEEPLDILWVNNGTYVSNELDIDSLPAGVYTFQIEDSEGCVSFGSVEVLQPELMEVAILSGDACFNENNGIITLDVLGGTKPYNFSWSTGDTTPGIANLNPGSYHVVVTDAHSCPEVEKSVTINEIPELVFNLEGADLICYNDGSGSVYFTDLEGGTGDYTTFLWYYDGSFYSENQYISGLQAGNYELQVTDDHGCNGLRSYNIGQPEPIEIELISLKDAIELGSIDLTVAGGTPPYSYIWNTGAITEDIDPLGGGVYTVFVTDDNQCKATGSIFVEVHYRIFAPTAFSPNGDGVNDTFFIFGLGTDLKEFRLTIFNRFGEVVFESVDVNEGWNGTLMNVGDRMPTEVYTWQAEIKYIGGESLVDKGNLTLLR